MKVKDIVEILKCQVLNEANMEEEVKTACGSDMMSDVLAFVKDQSVLLTGLMNPQVVRTAEMMDMHCIVFVRGKKIDPNVVALARQKEITVLASPYRMFTACGLLLFQRAAGRLRDSMSMLHLTYQVPGDDFTRAGEASGDVKHKLKKLGYEPDAVRRVSIAMYEGEINMVIHANGGEATVDIDPDRVDIILKDQGPGIADVDQAMQAGWSTAPDNVRALGFGAGMGLPNMKKYTDEMSIDTRIGEGTTITMAVRL